MAWRERLESETEIWRCFQGSIFVVDLRMGELVCDQDINGAMFDLYIQSMEFMSAGSLEELALGPRRVELLDKVGRGSAFVGFLSNIACGLNAGHEKSFAHGDLKPSNIMLHVEAGKSGFPKLMDFGISGSSSVSDIQHTNGFSGTPEYSAPELLRGENSSNAVSDIFSLGVVFWELLTGRRLVHFTDGVNDPRKRIHTALSQLEQQASITTVDFDRDLQLEKHQTTRLQNLLKKMLTLNKEQRTITLSSCIATLNQIASPEKVGSTTTNDIESVYRNTYRWPAWLHKLVGERPLYFLLKSYTSIDDEAKLKDAFRKRGIEGYSMYRLLGYFDYMLRLWVNDETEALVQEVIDDYIQQREWKCEIERIDIEQFAVSSDKNNKHIPFTDRIAALKEIAASAHENRDEEYNSLKRKSLVTSKLGDDRRGATAIRVFMFVVFPRASLDNLSWGMISQQLEAILRPYSNTSKPILRNLSIYQCRVQQVTGSKTQQSGMLFRFILTDFHKYGELITAISLQKNHLEAHVREKLRITSFFELDRQGVVESDDGHIVRAVEDLK